MADKDNFKKVSDTGDASGPLSLTDLQKAFNNEGSRPSRNSKKKEKGATCCGYFSIKTGFIMYGVFDILLMVGLFAVIIHYLVIKKKVKHVLYASLFLQVPNAFAFIYVMAVDKAISRKIYTYILAVKIGILAFTTPLVFMIANNDWMFAKFCGDYQSDDGSLTLASNPSLSSSDQETL